RDCAGSAVGVGVGVSVLKGLGVGVGVGVEPGRAGSDGMGEPLKIGVAAAPTGDAGTSSGPSAVGDVGVGASVGAGRVVDREGRNDSAPARSVAAALAITVANASGFPEGAAGAAAGPLQANSPATREATTATATRVAARIMTGSIADPLAPLAPVGKAFAR